MMAVAGLDFVVKEIGLEALRIVDKLGGFKLWLLRFDTLTDSS